MSQVLLKVENLTRSFVSGDESLTVLNQINLEINRGEMVAIVGASGSGKSTLMNVLGCLDQPTSGRYFINTPTFLDTPHLTHPHPSPDSPTPLT